ncbi:MAG: protein phosphatase 2C domain-containing protein [Byssovorax sp.]
MQTAPAPEVDRSPHNGASPSPAAHALTVESFGCTDMGRVRTTNEDQFVTATLMRALWIEQSSLQQAQMHYGDERGHVLIVADGMGGAHAGETASAVAVNAIEQFLLNALRWLLTLHGSEEAAVLRDFKVALRNADASVVAAAAGNPGLSGMGTTLTMAYSLGTDLFIAHVGDSRCYLHRGGGLHQLTRDHTLVGELVEKGLIQPEDAGAHPYRHVITNVVGGPKAGLHAEVHRMTLEAGDLILVCTDGLTGMVPDSQISTVLQGAATPRAASEELVRLAIEQGGRDNVTVIVARYS